MNKEKNLEEALNNIVLAPREILIDSLEYSFNKAKEYDICWENHSIEGSESCAKYYEKLKDKHYNYCRILNKEITKRDYQTQQVIHMFEIQ